MDFSRIVRNFAETKMDMLSPHSPYIQSDPSGKSVHRKLLNR